MIFMRISWLLGGLIFFFIGGFLTLTIIGAIIGVPMVLLGIFFLFMGVFLPEKKVVHVHHKN